jgi:Fe-S-cluster containining protein
VTLPGLPMGVVSKVDCGDCQACCKKMLILLEDGDDLSRDDWDWTVFGLCRVRKLKHKKNGDCIHLAKNGCAVYDRRPRVCRAFDCEDFVKNHANIRSCGNDPVISEGIRRLANKEKKS